MAEFKELIGTAGYAIEAVGVLVIIGGSIIASVKTRSSRSSRGLRHPRGDW